MSYDMKMVDGQLVPLTAAEIAELEARDAADAARAHNAALDAQIAALEATQTPRRMRDAALTEAGKTWLADLEEQIAALRAQRT